ncbi:MAG: EFR1 family ferrodoxin [Clostridiales bacterium]|nr:EFR1 family ferrodoxin [Clostridiales bacterium]
MKFVIYYFSGTGNTQWVAENIEKKLKENKHDIILYPIEKMREDVSDILQDSIETSDYIGFAYPLYGANIPRIMRNFIQEFVKTSSAYPDSNAKLFLVNTYAYVNGHGIFKAKKYFKECHLRVHGYVNFRMTNSAPSKKKDRAILGENLPSDMKKKAIVKIENMIRSFEDGRRHIQGIGPHLIMGRLIGRILRDEITSNYKNMHVNMETCSKCMKCVRECPVGSLVYKDEQFIYLETCEACMRCYNRCSKHAISN